MSNINSMFESIKTAMTKDSTSSRGQFIRTEVGNTYTVRLIPNIKDPNKTFFHYYTHGWTSFETGQYINLISPNTWGDRDPIAELRFKALKTGTAEEKAKASGILRKENWMVNVYVVNDPVKPENNGTIKLLRFGRQLHKIIMDAMEGEEAEELGPRIFDLGKNGCDFRIKVEKQGEYPTYVSSKFGMPKEINIEYTGGIDAIHKDVFDLEAVFSVKSYDELKAMLDEHYHCKVSTGVGIGATTPTKQVDVDKVETTSPPVVENKVKAAESTTTTTSDEDIEQLLANLDNM
jgi:hypothetical protein